MARLAPPLGYRGDRERMRLVVVPNEAEQVRTMFQLYLRLGSAAEVARRVNELGWERKTTRTRAGREVGGGAWTEKDVHMLLRNPIYLGKVDFKGERYEGEHEAIVDALLFERVFPTPLSHHARARRWKGARVREIAARSATRVMIW